MSIRSAKRSAKRSARSSPTPLITNISAMEPMRVPENKVIENSAFELIQKASTLTGQINSVVTKSVGELVRSMNCYYSNLIEGHNTSPRDIDRALHKDYSAEPKQRSLQKEAVAHIEVQQAIDESTDIDEFPTTTTYVKWLHREFCRRMPEDLLIVADPETGKAVRVEPGVLRKEEVSVGNHYPPASAELLSFLNRFERVYSPTHASKIAQVVFVPAAHHRFLWIHPFLDGNGRVARLMSHALFKRIGLGSSLWSASRGLARNVNTYKALLMAADGPRRNDLDGRGSLSLEALVEFCKFFLSVCIDQIDYMRSVLATDTLLDRIKVYVDEEARSKRLMSESFSLLREALLAGEFERGRASTITGLKERSARSALSTLVARGLLVSETPKASVRLGFPVNVVERWFPALYPSMR